MIIILLPINQKWLWICEEEETTCTAYWTIFKNSMRVCLNMYTMKWKIYNKKKSKIERYADYG